MRRARREGPPLPLPRPTRAGRPALPSRRRLARAGGTLPHHTRQVHARGHRRTDVRDGVLRRMEGRRRSWRGQDGGGGREFVPEDARGASAEDDVPAAHRPAGRGDADDRLALPAHRPPAFGGASLRRRVRRGRGGHGVARRRWDIREGSGREAPGGGARRGQGRVGGRRRRDGAQGLLQDSHVLRPRMDGQRARPAPPGVPQCSGGRRRLPPEREVPAGRSGPVPDGGPPRVAER